MGPGPVNIAVNVTALLDAATSDAGVLWIDTGRRTYAVWAAWADRRATAGVGPTAYILNGPGEQFLPWLPAEVSLVLRDRATGGRVLRVRAARRVLTDADAEYARAVATLRERRLNAPDASAEDTERRWRESCTVTAVRPFGEPLETPDSPQSGLAVTQVTSWRPTGG